MQHPGTGEQDLGHLRGIEHAVADGVVDLVEDNQIPLAGKNRLPRLCPCRLDQADILWIGLALLRIPEPVCLSTKFSPNAWTESCSPLSEEPLRNCSINTRIRLPTARRLVPSAAVVFALAGAGVDDDQTFARIGHGGSQ